MLRITWKFLFIYYSAADTRTKHDAAVCEPPIKGPTVNRRSTSAASRHVLHPSLHLPPRVTPTTADSHLAMKFGSTPSSAEIAKPSYDFGRD